MTILPKDIKKRFYKTIKGDISLDEFELWLYADKELEKYLKPDDYLDLISLSFKKNGAKHELSRLLKKHIDLGEFETYKILGLLKEAQQKNNKLPDILMEFYDLYCKGYYFLQDLGLTFGLAVEVPTKLNNPPVDTWDDLTTKQQKEILDSFSPKLEECLELAIYWLETKKIILIGEQDDVGRYGYEDFRTEEEKKSKFWTAVSESKVRNFSTSKNTHWSKQTDKRWWEFWK